MKHLLFVLLFTGTFCFGQNTTAKDTTLKQYLYKVHLTKKYHDDKNWTDKDNEIVGAHFKRLQDALQTGKLILAGRTSEENSKTFGIVIFYAKNEAEAKAFMESDPAVKAGIMSATLHPYSVALKE